MRWLLASGRCDRFPPQSRVTEVAEFKSIHYNVSANGGSVTIPASIQSWFQYVTARSLAVSLLVNTVLAADGIGRLQRRHWPIIFAHRRHRR